MNDLLAPPTWYALHVRSHHEKTVLTQLEAKEFAAFLPLYLCRHKWADRWKTLSLPLFPGYVFCCFTPSTQSAALATSGVIDVVRTGAQAAPVETSEIEAIRRVVHSPVAAEPYPSLVTGERVTLAGGPLSGLTGTLVGIRSGLRLVISVEILRRSVLVEIEREWVVASGRTGPVRNLRMPPQEPAFLRC